MDSVSRSRVALAGVVFVVLFSQVLVYPGIDTLVSALGAEVRIAGSMWFLAVEFIGFVVFAGVWGAVSDATGRRVPFIVLGSVLGSLGYVLLAVLPSVFSFSFLVVLVIRFFQGAVTIGAFSLSITMLMDLEGGHGKNMGAAGIAIGLGTALGAPVGGLLYTAGPVVPLYAASILLFLVAIFVRTLYDRAPRSRSIGIGAALTTVQRTPVLVLPYSFGFIDRLTAGFFSLVGTLYFRDIFGLDPVGTGVTLALFFAPFALLQYPFGVLSDRIGRTVPIVFGSICYGIGVWGIGVSSQLSIAQFGMVVVGVLGAIMAPATMALVTDIAGEAERGVAMAGFNIAGSLGFLSGIIVGGTVASEYSYRTAFATAGGLEVLIAVMTIPVFLRLSNRVLSTR